MRKIHVTIMVLIALCVCPILALAGDIATWENSNGQPYLNVKAKDYEVLGKLEGQNLAPQICYFKLLIMQKSLEVPGGYAQMREWANLYGAGIPEKYIKEMQGMVDGIADVNCSLCASAGGIDYVDILLQNSFMDITYGLLYPMGSVSPETETGMGCTIVGAVNTTDNDEEVSFGQTFDFNNELAPALSFVRTKVDGQPPHFSLRMGAVLSMPAGKNAYNVSFNVTVIRTKKFAEPWSSIFSGQSPPLVIPSGIFARMTIEEANTPDIAYDLLFSHPITASYTVMIGKDSKLIAAQVLPTVGVDRVDVQDMAVLTNRYTIAEWETYLIDPLYSSERQAYAEMKLVEAYSDSILTNEEMKSILADESSSNYNEHICRTSPPNRSGTLAVITQNAFGLRDCAAEQCFPQNLGVIPITLDP